MTSHEVYVALFWIVIGGYVSYLGWTLYRITVERAARRRHPSSLPHAVGEMSRYETEGTISDDDSEPSANSRSLVQLLFHIPKRDAAFGKQDEHVIKQVRCL